MKKICAAILVLVLTLAVGVGIAPPAAAGPEDIELTLEIRPPLAGNKGGDIELVVTAKNKGGTSMKLMEVGVTTMAGFAQGWNVTVPVGGSRTRIFDVHFDADDLGIDKLLTVTFDNDADPASDGTGVKTFRVNSTNDITDFAGADPASGVLRSDTRFGSTTYDIQMTFRNNMTKPLSDFTTEFYILDEENDHLYDSPSQAHGVVGAGSIKRVSFEYTPYRSHEGTVTVAYRLDYTYLNESYREFYLAQTYTVAQPVFADYTATLTPQAVIFEPDVPQLRTVEIVSTGSIGVDNIEVRELSGIVRAAGGPLEADGSLTLTFEITYDELGEFEERYIVYGWEDDFNLGRETNPITITVRELFDAVPIETQGGAAAETSEEPAEPTDSTENDAGADETEPGELADARSEQDADEVQSETPKSSSLVLYIIIGVLGLFIAAGAAVITFLLMRRKQKGGGKRGDKL